MRDWPIAETSDSTQYSHGTDIHVSGGFEPTIPASEWPQTHTLNCKATGLSQSQDMKKESIFVFSLSKSILCMCKRL